MALNNFFINYCLNKFCPYLLIGFLLFYNSDLDIWKGVGEAWLVGSKILNDRGIFLTRIISRRFKVIIKTQKYKRIQCVVHNKWKSSQKFVELLGFKNEGLMRKYGPDGFDYLRYAIVIGE